MSERRAKITWISIIVGILALSVGIHIVLIVAAVSDPSFAVQADYEERAANWDAIKREQQRSDRLGWTVDIDTRPAPLPGHVDVSLSAFNRFGGTVREADVAIEACHIARAAHVLKGTMPATGDGMYGLAMPMRRSGIWEFRVRITRGDDVYVNTFRQEVLAAAPVREPAGT